MERGISPRHFRASAARVAPVHLAALCFATLSYAVLAFATPLQGQDLLRWRFRAGDTWYYRTVQTGSTAMEAVRSPDSGQLVTPDMEMTQETTDIVRAVVREVDPDGAATVDLTYLRARMSGDVFGTRIEWSSDESAVPSDPMLGMVAAVTAAMVGHTVTMVVSPIGEVLEVRGIEEIEDAMFAAIEPALGALLNEQQMREMYEGMLQEDQLGSAFLGGLGTFPVDAVADTPVNSSNAPSG